MKKRTTKLSVQYVPMFKQQNVNLDGQAYNWAGDWIFRRERLELLDKQIIAVKPDVVLFQDLVFRDYSPSESEFYILSASSLSDYSWHISKTNFLRLTEETISTAVAAALPLKVDLLKSYGTKNFKNLNDNGGYLVASILKSPDGRIGVVSLDLRGNSNSGEVSYDGVVEALAELVNSTGICKERFIIAGVIPEDRIYNRDLDLISRLEMRDVAYGFCDEISSCYTDTKDNRLFQITNSSSINGRSRRILVHQKAEVIASGRNLMEKLKWKKINDVYNLKSTPFSDRYGWLTTLNLPTCNNLN